MYSGCGGGGGGGDTDSRPDSGSQLTGGGGK